jgi:hypothetical protein
MSMEQVVAGLAREAGRRYYGKYRGLVVDNADPEDLGRLRLRVPSLLGSDVVTGWALACAPYGGAPGQGLLLIPEVGTGVWVEFEEGDLEFPIWAGVYWAKPAGVSDLPRPVDASGASGDAPQRPPTAKILTTLKGHSLQLEDADGAESITIVEAAHGHVIRLDADGVTVTDGMSGHRVRLDDAGMLLADGANGHTVRLGPAGITIEDGVNGHRTELGAGGITISDGVGGSAIILGPGGVQIGGSAAVEPMVLGMQFAAQVTALMVALAAHTHICTAPTAPSGPPMAPLVLQVPLSAKHKVE